VLFWSGGAIGETDVIAVGSLVSAGHWEERLVWCRGRGRECR
jgi:hypothetical protein